MNKLLADHQRAGEEVFALAVSRRRFPNVGSATRWAKIHGLKPAEILTNEFEYYLRTYPPTSKRLNLRGVNILPGIRVIYAKGHDTS